MTNEELNARINDRLRLEDLTYKRYVIIEHCNGEIMSIKEKELSLEEVTKYYDDEHIVIEGKLISYE